MYAMFGSKRAVERPKGSCKGLDEGEFKVGASTAASEGATLNTASSVGSFVTSFMWRSSPPNQGGYGTPPAAFDIKVQPSLSYHGWKHLHLPCILSMSIIQLQG